MENAVLPSGGGTGYLVIQVTTASNAIPLEGAQVTLRDAGGRVLYELRSGRDGRTERVGLPAPSRNASARPSSTPPYALYHLEALLTGYDRAFYQNVPVFDGITAIQQIDLIPLPENGYPDGFTQSGGNQQEGFLNDPLGGA